MNFKSRSTVALETCTSSAVSSAVQPRKYLSSTNCTLFGSILPSSSRARFKSSSSALPTSTHGRSSLRGMCSIPIGGSYFPEVRVDKRHQLLKGRGLAVSPFRQKQSDLALGWLQKTT